MLVNNNNNNKTCQIVHFFARANHRVKIKESKKRDKYLDLARELKKIWAVMVIPIVIGALRTIAKGFLKELEDLEIREEK